MILALKMSLNVAEQSSACCYADAKTNMPSIERSFYLLSTPRYLCYSLVECKVLMALVFYYRDVRKGKDAKNPITLGFSVTKKTVKCRACTVSQKIITIE